MPGRPYILAETNWQTVEQTPYEVAILPWGATEAHNYHLPYSTDVVQCDEIVAAAARIAWEQDAKVIVLPTVPFGVNTGQFDIKLDLNLNPLDPTRRLARLGRGARPSGHSQTAHCKRSRRQRLQADGAGAFAALCDVYLLHGLV